MAAASASYEIKRLYGIVALWSLALLCVPLWYYSTRVYRAELWPDLVDALHLPNPRLAVSILSAASGHTTDVLRAEIERAVAGSSSGSLPEFQVHRTDQTMLRTALALREPGNSSHTAVQPCDRSVMCSFD